MPVLNEKKTISAFLTKSQLQARISEYNTDITRLKNGSGLEANAVATLGSLLASLGGMVSGTFVTVASFIHFATLAWAISLHESHRNVLQSAVNQMNANSNITAIRISVQYQYQVTNATLQTLRWVPIAGPYISGYRYRDGSEIIDN